MIKQAICFLILCLTASFPIRSEEYKDYYATKAELRFPELEDLLKSYFIPYAKENHFVARNDMLEVEFGPFAELKIKFIKHIPTYDDVWEDSTMPIPGESKTYICVIDSIPIRISTIGPCPYIRQLNAVIKYRAVEHNDRGMHLGIVDSEETWNFIIRSNRLKFVDVQSFISIDPDYLHSLIPPQYRLSR